MTASPANAQEDGRQFDAKAGVIVEDVLSLINLSQHSTAIDKLNEALEIPDLNPYERSTIYQMMGASHYETNNYAQAISSFESAINAGGLLPNESDSLRVNIAQLLIANGSYAQGAQMLENYLNSGGQKKPYIAEMGTGQSGDYSKALPRAEKWFNNASPKERKHFDLMNFLYKELDQTERQAEIIRQMINRWPDDKALWGGWASMLANDGHEQDAFEVTKMIYLGGALSNESDLMKVVQYYSFYDMPYQAAQILEREMNAGRISKSFERLVFLSDLYRQSREDKKAISILQRAAASSGQAKIYTGVGQALYNKGDCVNAEQAFNSAISKGYNDATKAYMLIGTCRYEEAQKEPRVDCRKTTKEERKASVKSQKREEAIEAFERVPFSSREGANAKKWISFIRAEENAFERRCEFELSVEKELCEQKIKQAYDADVTFDLFVTMDAKCLQYKVGYDAMNRVKTKAE